MDVIVGKQGTQPFIITDRSVSRRHAKITYVGDEKYQIEDLNSTNGTFVDGVRVIKKIVSAGTMVRLGDSYTFRVDDAMPKEHGAHSSSTGNDALKQQPEYSIAHLEKVWDRYDQSLKALRDRNKSIGLMSRVSPLFTLGSGAIAGVARMGSWDNSIFTITSLMTVVGLAIMIYSIIQTKSFDFDREKEMLDDKFIEDYTCPNPACKHFMGFQRYSILSQNKNCPYCRCKLTH